MMAGLIVTACVPSEIRIPLSVGLLSVEFSKPNPKMQWV